MFRAQRLATARWGSAHQIPALHQPRPPRHGGWCGLPLDSLFELLLQFISNQRIEDSRQRVFYTFLPFSRSCFARRKLLLRVLFDKEKDSENDAWQHDVANRGRADPFRERYPSLALTFAIHFGDHPSCHACL